MYTRERSCEECEILVDIINIPNNGINNKDKSIIKSRNYKEYNLPLRAN